MIHMVVLLNYKELLKLHTHGSCLTHIFTAHTIATAIPSTAVTTTMMRMMVRSSMRRVRSLVIVVSACYFFSWCFLGML